MVYTIAYLNDFVNIEYKLQKGVILYIHVVAFAVYHYYSFISSACAVSGHDENLNKAYFIWEFVPGMNLIHMLQRTSKCVKKSCSGFVFTFHSKTNPPLNILDPPL